MDGSLVFDASSSRGGSMGMNNPKQPRQVLTRNRSKEEEERKIVVLQSSTSEDDEELAPFGTPFPLHAINHLLIFSPCFPSTLPLLPSVTRESKLNREEWHMAFPLYREAPPLQSFVPMHLTSSLLYNSSRAGVARRGREKVLQITAMAGALVEEVKNWLISLLQGFMGGWSSITGPQPHPHEFKEEKGSEHDSEIGIATSRAAKLPTVSKPPPPKTNSAEA